MINSFKLTPCLIGMLLWGALPPAGWADEIAIQTAERAIAAKYEAVRLQQEKKSAESTIKQAERTLKSINGRIDKTRKAVQQAQQEQEAAEKNVAQLKAAAEQAQQKASETNDKADQAAAKKATDELQAAERVLQQKTGAHNQAAKRLKREEDQINKANADMAAAKKAIPEKEAAGKVALKKADQLRQKAFEAAVAHAAQQQPSIIAQQIDRHIDRRLAEAKIPPSPRADDGEFLRRVTLDILGRIPTYDETVEFLESDASDERAQVINRLLQSDEYGQRFGTLFCDLTTDRPTSTAKNTVAQHFAEWLAESLNLNRRWDRIVQDMLSAEGQVIDRPGSVFLVAYRNNEQPDPAAIIAASGEYFMGLQVKCAQCHDHPFVADWSQDDFWGMAALFSRLRLKGASNNRPLDFLLTDNDVTEKELLKAPRIKYPEPLPGGKIVIADPTDPTKTLRTVSARYLDDTVPKLPENGMYRQEFSKWLTSPENPYFARAAVNRLWAHFFSRGLIHPVSNMTESPSHPQVLAALEEEFKKSGYDLKHLIRCLVNSAAYQRTSRPLDGNADDKTLFSHMAIKTLQADDLMDALTIAIGRTRVKGTRRNDVKELFATRLPDGDATKFTHGIPQILRIMNAKEYNEADSVVGKVTNGKEPSEAIAGLFLAALSRRPVAEETAAMLKFVEESENPRNAYKDVYWVLLNSAEFLVNH